MNIVVHSDPKKAAMLAALENNLGVVTEAAREAGIGRTTHYLWMNEDEEYKAMVNDLGDVILDFAEAKLHSLVKKGDVASTIFLLKTKGKKRGYVERSELTGADGGPLQIEPITGMQFRKELPIPTSISPEILPASTERLDL